MNVFFDQNIFDQISGSHVLGKKTKGEMNLKGRSRRAESEEKWLKETEQENGNKMEERRNCCWPRLPRQQQQQQQQQQQ